MPLPLLQVSPPSSEYFQVDVSSKPVTLTFVSLVILSPDVPVPPDVSLFKVTVISSAV